MDPYIVRRIGDVTIERVLPKQPENSTQLHASGSKDDIPMSQMQSANDIHGDFQEPLMKESEDGGGDDENDGEQSSGIGNFGKFDSDSYLKGQSSDMDNSFVSGLANSSMFGDLNEQQYPGMSMAKDWKLGSGVSLDMVKPSSASEMSESLPESDDIQELTPVNITGKNSIKNIDNPLLANKIDTTQYKLGTGISLEMISTPLTPVKDSNLNFNTSLNNMSSTSCERQPSQMETNFNQSNLQHEQHNIAGANIGNNKFSGTLNPEMNIPEKSSFASVGSLISQMNSSSSSSFADANINNPSYISNSENDRQNMSINKTLSDNSNFLQNDYISNNSQTNDNSIGNFSSNIHGNESSMNLCHDNTGGNIFRDSNNISNYSQGNLTNLNPPNTGYNASAPDIYNPNSNFGVTSNDKPPVQNYNYGNICNLPQPSFGDNYNMGYKISGNNVNMDMTGQSGMPNMNSSMQKPSSCDVPPVSNAPQMSCNSTGYNNFQNINASDVNVRNNADNSYENSSSMVPQLNDSNSSDYKIGSGVSLSTIKPSSVKNTTDDSMSRIEKSPGSTQSATRPSSVNSMTDTDEYKKPIGNEFRLGSGVSLDIVRPKVENKDFKMSSDINVNVVRPTSDTSQDSFSGSNSNNDRNKSDLESNAMETLKNLELLNEAHNENKDVPEEDKEKKLIKLESMLGDDELDPEEEEEMYGNLEDDEQVFMIFYVLV